MPKMDYKVSVIIPVYNTERFVSKCLRSIINQTYTNLEVIVVNDGSTDNSLKIVKDIAKENKKIFVINTSNNGAGYARNIGISRATGEYIMFVDSDDWIDLTCIEKCMEQVYKNEKIDCVMFPYAREYGSRSKIQYTLGDKNKFFFFPSKRKNVLLRRIIGLTNKEIKRPDSINDINGPVGKLCKTDCFCNVKYPSKETIECGEDGWFNASLFLNIRSVYYIAEPFYHYNKLNQTSLVHSYHDDLLNQYKRQWNHFRYIIDENSLGDDFYEALNNRIACSCLDLARNILHTKMSKREKNKQIFMILNDIDISDALDKCSLANMDFKWKIYYMLCKKRISYGVLFMTNAAEQLKSYLR